MTTFTCNHLTILCTSLSRMKEFYADKLGMQILEDDPNVLALRAGSMRFSFFTSQENFAKPNRVQSILRTDDIEAARADAEAVGMSPIGAIVEAPNLMKFFSINDPDGSVVYIAEYLRDPLVGV